MTSNALLAVIVLWVLVISIIDFKKRTIPNYLSLGGVLMAALTLTLTGETANHEPVTSSLLGFVIALAFTIPGYMSRMLGGGDVKFLSAVGALLGFEVMLISFTVATSAIAVTWVLWRHSQRFIQLLPFKDLTYQKIDLKRRGIPFGSVLGVSLILTLLYLNLLNFT